MQNDKSTNSKYEYKLMILGYINITKITLMKIYNLFTYNECN